MELNKERFNPLRLAKVFFLLFLIFLFFPVLYVFPTASSYATGLYSDFTSFSLYLSDIYLFIAFLFILWYNYKYFTKLFCFPHILAIISLFLLLILQHKSISGLNIWYFVKFLEISLVSYGTTVAISNDTFQISKKGFLITFLGLGTLQSAIGLWQFIEQSSLGLNVLGEQILNPTLWGVAKIVSGGTTFIRAYGTFPHPNLLSAFLLVTVFINIYLLSSTTWGRSTKIWLNLALFINIIGLTATFSRGAYLALGVGLLAYFGFLAVWQGIRSYTYIILKVGIALGIALFIFKPFLFTRATFKDQAALERKIYNQTAINIIKDKPITGIGMGESVLHMEQYSPAPLNPYQIQPIHNYFLLAAAELGIPGLLILIWIFILHLKKLIFSIKYDISAELNTKYFIQNTNQNKEKVLYKLTLLTILISFLVLMQFDHYFYTLQQTQMLLWIVLGLIAAETKKSPQ